MDQASSRSNSDHDLFCGASLALEKEEASKYFSSTKLMTIAGCCIKSTFVTRYNPIEKWFFVVA